MARETGVQSQAELHQNSKMVLGSALLNTQYYNVQIKGKWSILRKMSCVTLYRWPAKQTIPLSVLARNQTKGFWTWNLAVSGSGKGTPEESWLEKGADESWRGTTDRGSWRQDSREANQQKIGSSEEDRVKMSAFQLLCGIFASNPCYP